MKSPKVFISYSHGNRDFMTSVLELSNKFRTVGIDCEIDQYELMPSEGWSNWCLNKIREANFVLVIATERYFNSFEGRVDPNNGKGATFEGFVITEEIYQNHSKNDKFIPVIFNENDKRYIPTLLKEASHYNLKENFDSLYRHISGQPSITKPPLGDFVYLPPKDVKTDFKSVRSFEQISYNKYKGLHYLNKNEQGFEEYKNLKDESIVIRIPQGTFLRGVSTDQDGAPDGRPQKKITLEEFFIDKYPVTNKQFERFILQSGYSVAGKNGIVYDRVGKCWRRDFQRTWEDFYDAETENHPVVFITWEDAVEYSKWAGKRLPTEAEWEMTSKGPLKLNGEVENIYPWGDIDPDKSFANFNLNKPRTTPIDKYPKGISPYGCYDMAGNVWEWCYDYYDITYYDYGSKENPKGPDKGNRRINRGGSWLDDKETLKCSFRVGDDSLKYSHVGFRCALSFKS